MTAAEAIVRILEREGITSAFGIPGAAINGVYKFLATSKIKHYCVRHEEAAVHAADAYFRACGKLGIAICTSGPGATNFVTGLYTAHVDSIPLIAITGQAVTAQLGKDAFQCVDIARICEPVAKATFCITDSKKVVEIFQNAFKLAKSGKPGPVLLDLPLDWGTSDSLSLWKSWRLQRPIVCQIEQFVRNCVVHSASAAPALQAMAHGGRAFGKRVAIGNFSTFS